MAKIWTWRAQHPSLPLYMEGTEFFKLEARDQGLKARYRMAKAYDYLKPLEVAVTVKGPRGGVERLAHVKGSKAACRWTTARK